MTEGGGGGSWVFSYSGAVVTAAGGPGSVVHSESVPTVIEHNYFSRIQFVKKTQIQLSASVIVSEKTTLIAHICSYTLCSSGLPLFFLLVFKFLLIKRIAASKTAIIKPSSVRQRAVESPVTVGVPKKHILTYNAGLVVVEPTIFLLVSCRG